MTYRWASRSRRRPSAATGRRVVARWLISRADRGQLAAERRRLRAADPEDEPRRRRAAVEDLLDRRVDVVERALFVLEPREPAPVQLEDLFQVMARADDRAVDVEAAEHGLEDGQLEVVLGGEADAHEAAAAGERTEGLLEGLGADRGGDRRVRAAEPLDRGHGVLLERVHEVLGANGACALQPGRVDVDGDHRRAGDAGVLDREVPEAADAEDGDDARRAGAGVLDRLVGGHAGAGQR